MLEPIVSLIIPTYNRREFLQQTLESLNNQSWPQDKIEVVVVDDGSKDDTSMIAEFQYPFLLNYICQENQGSAAARNRGAQESRGEILIFIDDDIRIGQDYIRGLVEEHQSFPRIIGMGTVFTYSADSGSTFSKTFSDYVNPKNGDLKGDFVSFTECTTNNLSILREDFFKLGMMQDIAGDGPTWWGDVDFGYRAHLAGYKFRRSGKSVCSHLDYSIQNLKSFCLRNQKAAQMAVLLFQKHPELQTHLPMFFDKTPISFGRDPLPLMVHKTWHHVQAMKPIQKAMENVVFLLEAAAPHPALLWPLYRWIMSSYIYQGYQTGLRQYGTVKRG